MKKAKYLPIILLAILLTACQLGGTPTQATAPVLPVATATIAATATIEAPATAAPTNTAVPPTQTAAPTTAPTSKGLPECRKVNGATSAYESLWLRQDGSGIYVLDASKTTAIDQNTKYLVEGKAPYSEDHLIFWWDTTETVEMRGFGLWNCGPKSYFDDDLAQLQLDYNGWQKWTNDHTAPNNVDHNIVIYHIDGSDPDRYDNGAEVPLPEEMKSVLYASCDDLKDPKRQNTPGDVNEMGGVMISTLGQPKCGSLFIGKRDIDGKNVAVFWTGVDERFSYIEGNFFVFPKSYTIADIANYIEVKDLMTELEVTTIQDKDGNTIYPK